MSAATKHGSPILRKILIFTNVRKKKKNEPTNDGGNFKNYIKILGPCSKPTGSAVLGNHIILKLPSDSHPQSRLRALAHNRNKVSPHGQGYKMPSSFLYSRPP